MIKLFNSLWVTGYNDVLLIPVGATNIVIREVKPSNNYLGNRKLDLIRHSLWCPQEWAFFLGQPRSLGVTLGDSILRNYTISWKTEINVLLI